MAEWQDQRDHQGGQGDYCLGAGEGVLRHHYSGREEDLKVVRKRQEELEESLGQRAPDWTGAWLPSCMRGH